MRPIDHFARRALVSLRDHVRALRDAARDADWRGDTDTARRLDREADNAITAGDDPVPMF